MDREGRNAGGGGMNRFVLIPLALAACAQPEPIYDASTYTPGKAGVMSAPVPLPRPEKQEFDWCPRGTELAGQALYPVGMPVKFFCEERGERTVAAPPEKPEPPKPEKPKKPKKPKKKDRHK